MKINIINEYNPLVTCIVGNCLETPFPKTIDDIDITFKSFYYDNIFPLIRKEVKCKSRITYDDIKFIEPQIYEERIEDLNNLAEVLQDLGVGVYRPNLHVSREINSPNWTAMSYPASNVRDNILVTHDYIIETSPHIRGRYFENELLYDILYDIFESSNCKWIKLPSSRLKENNIDQRYYEDESPLGKRYECIFDAAQCIKLDEGLVINYSNENHLLGIQALRRILPDYIEIYPVQVTDNHIDGMIVPIDRDVLLVNPKLDISKLPPFITKYKLIEVTDREISDGLCLASESIMINCLSVGNKTVIINEQAVSTIKKLEELKFNVIPIRFRHSRIYSGGIHCSTLDIERKI